MATDLSGYGVQLKSITKEHLEQLRQWRNDPAICQFMISQDTISEQQQKDWFHHIAKIKSQQHFVVCYRNAPIGAANIKEQNQQPILTIEQAKKEFSETGHSKTGHSKTEKRIEPGIYLGDEKFRNNVLAFAPSLVLLDYCFDDLGVTTLYATVHENNVAALNYNQKLGYRQMSKADGWIAIELTRKDYQQATSAIKRFLLRRTK